MKLNAILINQSITKSRIAMENDIFFNENLI
jgi:hypothetical protein